jgi:chemotaxis protein methyltransferase CheR
MMDAKEKLEIEKIEVTLFVEAVYLKYGYDFRDYSRAHIKRRLVRRVRLMNLSDITGLTALVLYDPEVFRMVLSDFSINVTEMFRHPRFFRDLRTEIIPILKTYPSFTIWHAGCSTGEEVISTAILLEEEGLLERAKIYATDMNAAVIQVAKEGIYPASDIKKWTKNYQESGGRQSFSDFFVVNYDYAIANQRLLEKITYLEHNLVTDGPFIGADLILCRNVLIYFNKSLQNRALDLFSESLLPGGFLGIGSKEDIRFSSVSDDFENVVNCQKIYKKKIEEMR